MGTPGAVGFFLFLFLSVVFFNVITFSVISIIFFIINIYFPLYLSFLHILTETAWRDQPRLTLHPT